MASFAEKVSKRFGKRSSAPFQAASDAQKAIYLRHIREGDNPSAARKAAGITVAMFNHATASDRAFLDAWTEAHETRDESFLDRLEQRIEEQAIKGDGAMSRWILERKRPEKWGQKAQVRVTHEFQSIDDIKKLSNEDLVAKCEVLGIEVQL